MVDPLQDPQHTTRQAITDKDRIAELEAALREAREDLESWGAYASNYFQEKHDLQSDLARIDAVLNKGEKA
jgi:hypothetical protein